MIFALALTVLLILVGELYIWWWYWILKPIHLSRRAGKPLPKIAVICLQLTLFMPVSAATFAPFFAGRQEYFWSYGANAFLEANESESAMFATCRAQIR